MAKSMRECERNESASRTKLKAACQEERLLKCKEHFKKNLGNPLEINDKPTQKNH